MATGTPGSEDCLACKSIHTCVSEKLHVLIFSRITTIQLYIEMVHLFWE